MIRYTDILLYDTNQIVKSNKKIENFFYQILIKVVLPSYRSYRSLYQSVNNVFSFRRFSAPQPYGPTK